ncbi:MAG: preprotein translocase subunit SecE [Acidobacteriaceae bacterium]|nr:preprotein translocase subunit SecE [Acidobacteriaceae bacterium]
MATLQMADENAGSLMQRVGSWPTRVKDYYEELKLEMRRVSWPSWKQVRATTLVVIVSVFAFAAYFALVDEIVGSAINKLFNSLTR